MRALIIEDDFETGDYLRLGLAEEGFAVDLASNGIDGNHLALSGDYGVILLDVTLPGMDGWQVLQYLRREGKRTPVIMLTAHSQVADRIKGFELGADDYLVKPFSFTELLARVRLIMRRDTKQKLKVFQASDLVLDVIRHRVTRGGKRINLTAKEFGLLALLLSHSGEVLSRTRIAEQVWDINFDGHTNVVDVAVRRLRAKVDDMFDPKVIHTQRGMGYILEVRN